VRKGRGFPAEFADVDGQEGSGLAVDDLGMHDRAAAREMVDGLGEGVAVEGEVFRRRPLRHEVHEAEVADERPVGPRQALDVGEDRLEDRIQGRGLPGGGGLRHVVGKRRRTRLDPAAEHVDLPVGQPGERRLGHDDRFVVGGHPLEDRRAARVAGDDAAGFGE